MGLLTLGVLATSRKENERRLPIHPHHFERIDADLRANLVLEAGYGERFGVTDILINYVDPVIGAHSGPGTMALFFLASER